MSLRQPRLDIGYYFGAAICKYLKFRAKLAVFRENDYSFVTPRTNYAAFDLDNANL
jgi:hypothetical protein